MATYPAYPNIARPLGYRERAVRSSGDRREAWRHAMAWWWPIGALLSLMFVPQLGALGPIFFLLMVGLAFFPVPLLPVDRWGVLIPLMIVPAFALLSALWSVDRPTTLRFATQMTLTVLAGAMLGASPYRRTVVFGVFTAFATYVVSAMILGASVNWGANQGTAFAGFNAGKNYFGDMCAIAVMATVGAAVLVGRAKTRLGLVVAAGLVGLAGLEMTGLLASNSSGALLGVAVALAVFACLLLYTRADRNLRLLFLLLAVVVVVVGGVMAVLEAQALQEGALAVFNKDSSLTGRAYLWYRSQAIMADRPLLGVGYGAFWVQGRADAEGLWAYNLIVARMGFNFHNTMIENRVNMGWVGYILLAATAVGCMAVQIVRFFRRPSTTDLFWIAILTYNLVRVGFEAVGPTPFNHTTLLLSAALAAGLTGGRGDEAGTDVDIRGATTDTA